MHEIHIGTVIHVWYPCEKYFCKRGENCRVITGQKKKRIESKCQVPIEEKLDEISAVLQRSPQKSLGHLVQKTVVSGLKFTPKKFNLNIFWRSMDVCGTTESISSICYNLVELYL
jgi:hypothetical protein